MSAIQAFHCPNCNAPLDLPDGKLKTVRCPFCNTSVIVPESIRESSKRRIVDWTNFDLGLNENQQAFLNNMTDPAQIARLVEIGKLASRGNKIEAIKRYRELFNTGLAEAKEAVEQLAEGRVMEFTHISVQNGSQPVQIQTEVVSNIPLSAEESTALYQVSQLVRDGERTKAARLYQTTFVSTIQEANAVVDEFYRNPTLEPNAVLQRVRSRFAGKPSRKGVFAILGGGSCLLTLVVILFALGILIIPLIAMASPGGPLGPLWSSINPAGFAGMSKSFGGEGIGEGLFTDPRTIAVAADGEVFVGDYQDQRVQRFSPEGEYLSGWKMEGDSIINKLDVDRNGIVYVVYNGDVQKYEGKTGQWIGTVGNPEDHYFDDIVLTTDGGMLLLYQGDDLLRLDASGKVLWNIEDIVENVSKDSELSGEITVDGLGNIYVMAPFNDAVFKYSPDGSFINRWGSAGDDAGQFRALNAIAVDGQGRVYVSDIRGIQVFDSEGRYLDLIDVNGVVFGMDFHNNNELWTANNQWVVQKFTIKK